MPCLLEEVPGLLAAEADHCHQVGRVPAVPEELEPHAGARVADGVSGDARPWDDGVAEPHNSVFSTSLEAVAEHG